MKARREKGQIAIFFAVAFVFFLSLYMIVVSSTVLTAKKINLQTSLDLAVKAAAQVQTNHLNQIIEYNKQIHQEWIQLEVNLNNPWHWKYTPCGGYAWCCIGTLSDPPSQCKKKDDAARLMIFLDYWKKRTALAMSIRNEIEKTNSKAYEASLEILLKENHIPQDFKKVLEKSFGGTYPEAKLLASIYDTRTFRFKEKESEETLKERIEYNDQVKKMGLFSYEDDNKMVLYTGWKYKRCSCGSPLVPYWAFSGPKLSKKKYSPVGLPKVRGRYYKIKQTNDSPEPFFFTTLAYDPVYDFNIFKIFRVKWDESKALTAVKTIDKRLFKKRQKMILAAMARPVGGDINSDTKYSFEKTELMGIADIGKIKIEPQEDLKYFLH